MSNIRVWAAVCIDGQIQCRITDLPGSDGLKSTPDYRWWQIVCWEGGRPPVKPGHARTCGPQKPCAKCHREARHWWGEWQARADERVYRVAEAEARTEQEAGRSYSCLLYCRPPSLEKATILARAGGFPLIHEADGHGRFLRWLEVTNG